MWLKSHDQTQRVNLGLLASPYKKAVPLVVIKCKKNGKIMKRMSKMQEVIDKRVFVYSNPNSSFVNA